MAKLQGLANSGYLQSGELQSANISGQLLLRILCGNESDVDRIFILNTNKIATLIIPQTIVGIDFSDTDCVKQTKRM